MTTRKHIFILMLLAASLATTSCGKARREDTPGADPRYALRTDTPPGDYEIAFTMLSTTVASGNGGSVRVDMAITMNLEVDPADADGVKRAVLSFIRLKIDTNGTHFDSAAIDESRIPKMFPTETTAYGGLTKLWRDIEPIRIIVAMGEDGSQRILAIEGANDGSAVAEKVRSLISSAGFGDDSSGGAVHDMAEMLPPVPVGVGAIWHSNITTTDSDLGVSGYEVECELMAVEDTPEGKIATIEYTGDISAKPNHTNRKGMRIKKVDMDIQGTILLNIDTGLLVDTSAKVVSKLKVVVRGKSSKLSMNIATDLLTRRR